MRKLITRYQFSNLKLSSFLATICCFVLNFSIQFNNASAQVTPCSTCNANDVNVISVELVQLNPDYASDHSLPKYISLSATCTGNEQIDRKSTRLNSSHLGISYAVFCLKKKNIQP